MALNVLLNVALIATIFPLPLVTYYLHAGNMIVYIENPQDVYSLQEIINKFDKVVGYKINTEKYLSVLVCERTH